MPNIEVEKSKSKKDGMPPPAPPSPSRQSIKSLNMDNLMNVTDGIFNGLEGAEELDFEYDRFSIKTFSILELNKEGKRPREAVETDKYGLPIGDFGAISEKPKLLDPEAVDYKWRFKGFMNVPREVGNFTYSCWSNPPAHRAKRGN